MSKHVIVTNLILDSLWLSGKGLAIDVSGLLFCQAHTELSNRLDPDTFDDLDKFLLYFLQPHKVVLRSPSTCKLKASTPVDWAVYNSNAQHLRMVGCSKQRAFPPKPAHEDYLPLGRRKSAREERLKPVLGPPFKLQTCRRNESGRLRYHVSSRLWHTRSARHPHV